MNPKNFAKQMRTACKLLPLPRLHAWTTFCNFYFFDIDISFRFNVPRSRDTLSLYFLSSLLWAWHVLYFGRFFSTVKTNEFVVSLINTLVNIRVQVSFDG
ncbi:hypothetical protein ES332_A12G275900v1 [Gossypium tomentosum]|uniref:Uncharacterized protein n=1 Tax=Gossypium tomentosum TaxID=34277 RepID=A0A5D2N2U5_GOSTO|nr:hypothetical protein ES332_A12G275900v1 [Gossypium tomentosum]